MTRAFMGIAVVLLLAGCGSGDNSGGSATPADSTPTATGSTGCQPTTGGGTGSRTSPALQNRETDYLTDVAATTGDCTERVVFTIKKGASPGPGYDVHYAPAESAKIEDGSGNQIKIEGSAFLVVKLQPAATAETNGDQLKMTYTGPRRLSPDSGRHVKEIVKTGDFEAVVTWVIGLDAQRPFTATASKTQLVVEIS